MAIPWCTLFAVPSGPGCCMLHPFFRFADISAKSLKQEILIPVLCGAIYKSKTKICETTKFSRLRITRRGSPSTHSAQARKMVESKPASAAPTASSTAPPSRPQPSAPRAIAIGKLVVRKTADIGSEKIADLPVGSCVVVLERHEDAKTRSVRARIGLESTPPGANAIAALGWVTAFKDGEAKLEAMPLTPRSSESMAGRIARRRQDRREAAARSRSYAAPSDVRIRQRIRRAAEASKSSHTGAPGSSPPLVLASAVCDSAAAWIERKQMQASEMEQPGGGSAAALVAVSLHHQNPSGRAYTSSRRPTSPTLSPSVSPSRRVQSSPERLRQVVEAMVQGAPPSSLASPTRQRMLPSERLVDDAMRTARRLANLSERAVPGPGQYEPRPLELDRARLIGSTVFRSQSERIKMQLNQTGDPGEYETQIGSLAAATAASSSYSKSGRVGKSSFGSRSERNVTYDPTRSAVFEVLGYDGFGGAGHETPSPDRYTLQDRHLSNFDRAKPSSAFKSSGRVEFKQDSRHNPGPGAYHARYSLTTNHDPGMSPTTNSVPKSGREVWIGASDVDNWSLKADSIHSRPHVGPGTYSVDDRMISGGLRSNGRFVSASMASDSQLRPFAATWNTK
jgi:hypothetical protein